MAASHPSPKPEESLSLKIHKSYRTVVALCDADLLGKKFEECMENSLNSRNSPDRDSGTKDDKTNQNLCIKQIDCRESFYKDKIISHEEAVKVLQFQMNEDATFNIVGEKSTRAAIDADLIEEEECVIIAGIPFTLVF